MKSLDFSISEFEEILLKTNELIIKQYKNLDNQKGFNVSSQSEVASWFSEDLPIEPMPLAQLFEETERKVLESATGNLGKNMYAYVMSGGNQLSTIADFIISTINQNNTKWHLAPAMTEIEKRVVKWAAQMLGYTPEAGGAMVSGGSEANLAGLTVARNIFFQHLNIAQNGLFGQKPFMVYCSNETHNCVDKSLVMLGIGTNQLRRLPTKEDFTIDIQQLEQQILSDIKNDLMPFCLIGNAGTVNTGAIDDLDALSKITKKYNMWFHVDGAYGGLACALPTIRAQYVGLEKADSIALDFHKWLYQPFEIGCVLVKNWDMLRNTYFKRADYLEAKFAQTTRFEYNEHYFQLSRNAKAFKVWFSLKAYGFAQFREMMQKDIDLTQYLKHLIATSADFRLKSEGSLAVVCFQYKGNLTDDKHIEDFNQQLIPALEADGRIFIAGTKLKGEFVLRACLINHRKDKKDVEYLLTTIRTVAMKIIL